MKTINQNSDLQAYSLLPRSEAPVEVSPVVISPEPEDALASENKVDSLKFYAKALMLQWKAEQRPRQESTYTSGPAAEPMLTAGPKIEQLLYSFSLLISRTRSNHNNGNNKSAGGEIAACALREQPLADEKAEARSYVLFAAKNRGFYKEDRTLRQRIQSYRDGVSKKESFHCPTALEPNQKAMLDRLINLHDELAERHEAEDLRTTLIQVASFVAQNRELARSIGLCCSERRESVDKIWDEVERLSRVGMAVECVKIFRQEVIRTDSTFSIVPITPSQGERFSDGVTFEDAIQAIQTYTDKTSAAEKKVFSLKPDFSRRLRDSWHVHCEVQLLEYFLVKDKDGVKNFYDYIGCSKEPCWLCDFVVRTATNFRMTESHGGIYWNWHLPTSLLNKNSSFREAVERIDNKMLDIIKNARTSNGWNATAKRRESLRDNYFLDEISADSPNNEKQLPPESENSL